MLLRHHARFERAAVGAPVVQGDEGARPGAHRPTPSRAAVTARAVVAIGRDDSVPISGSAQPGQDAASPGGAFARRLAVGGRRHGGPRHGRLCSRRRTRRHEGGGGGELAAAAAPCRTVAHTWRFATRAYDRQCRWEQSHANAACLTPRATLAARRKASSMCSARGKLVVPGSCRHRRASELGAGAKFWRRRSSSCEQCDAARLTAAAASGAQGADGRSRGEGARRATGGEAGRVAGVPTLRFPEPSEVAETHAVARCTPHTTYCKTVRCSRAGHGRRRPCWFT